MKQKDPSFTFACIAIVVGLIAAFGCVVLSARGLQTQIDAAAVAQR
jgi:hypothetical protein